MSNINFHDLSAQKYWAPPSSWSKEKIIETTKNRIFSGDWIGARKIDGAFYKFVKDENGNMELLGRTKGVNGDYLNKIDWVPQLKDFFSILPNGTCLLGELYFPNKEGSRYVTTITGCLVDKAIQRQETGDKLHYYIFDILQWAGSEFVTNQNMRNRISFLETYVKNLSKKSEYVKIAEYYEGEELWNQLQSILANGGEGIVITRKNALYQPDKRPSKDCMKVKQELKQTIDCVVIGANKPTVNYTGKDIDNWNYWYNVATSEPLPIIEEPWRYHQDAINGLPYQAVTKNYYYGWAGSLKIGLYNKNNKLEYFGDLSGLTDEVKENWKNYIGKVCEVGGMQITNGTDGKPSIRHPKLLQWREDKNKYDCTWEQVYEND